MWLGAAQLLEKITCLEVIVPGTRVTVSESARDLEVVINRELSMAAHVTAVCRVGYNYLCQLQPVVCIHHHDTCPGVHLVVWTTATHCCMASVTGYFAACSLYRMLQRAW